MWHGVAHTPVSAPSLSTGWNVAPLFRQEWPLVTSHPSPRQPPPQPCNKASPTLDTNVCISLNATQTRLPLAALFGPQTRAPLGLGAPSAQRTEGGRICGRIYTWSARGPANDDAPRHTAWTAQFKSFNELQSLARNSSCCFEFLPCPFRTAGLLWLSETGRLRKTGLVLSQLLG